MSSKTTNTGSSAIHPPIGTLIDGDSLELVEVLGVGGYGVVYRAVDTKSLTGPKSYAVKCLVHSTHQTARQRQVHIREIALHQIASAHPGVVTLHRVVENYNHTYIIMDYAPDHDLFTQILYSCRYLGDDMLIKHVFLQLLDAVEYCHSLGIYHRDLKPENVLCFDDGLRVAITDFGLATTDKVSDEFRTGSVFHMSPECQGGDFAPTGKYSPMFNDIWSLGIILLNLATGRNPWKSATADDPTFQAYLRDPVGFLPTVLPISAELNDILVRMLDVDWRERMTLSEVRYAIEDINSFYSEGVIFEGSMARCPWESGMEIDSDSSDVTQDDYPPPPKSPSPQPDKKNLASHWSKDSTSDIVFASNSLAAESSYGEPWTNYSSCAATWAYESSASSNIGHYPMDTYERSRSSSSSDTPDSSLPATPSALDLEFASNAKVSPRTRLTINTSIPDARFHEANASMVSSTGSSMMQTAIEYDSYSSSYYLAGSEAQSKVIMVVPESATTVIEDKEMISPSTWRSSTTDMSSPSIYSISSSSHSSLDNREITFNRSTTPSPDTWFNHQADLECSPVSPQSQPTPTVSVLNSDIYHPYPRPAVNVFSKKPIETKRKATGGIFSLKLFPRASPAGSSSSEQQHRSYSNRKRGSFDSECHAPYSHSASTTPPPLFENARWTGLSPQMETLKTQPTANRRTSPLRSPRTWFIRGRFFASGASS